MRDYSGKYKYYTHTDAYGRTVVIAVSTYEGKTVKGYAKCDTKDVFDLENGKKLAAARCNLKIAKKRAKRAFCKVSQAYADYVEGANWYNKMVDYYNDSNEAVEEAIAELAELEKSM